MDRSPLKHIVMAFAAMVFIVACNREKEPAYLFTQLESGQTGISFANNLNESADFNIIEYLYFYNGAGVGIGDINNDGLSDVYFVSNQGPNSLYLNKGNFKFDDIAATAGVEGSGNWNTGVSMADFNGDGWLDIFVCGVGNYKKFDGSNKIYVNNGDLTFTDKTDEYGLSFRGFSTQTAVLDFDLDGDLDIYLLNHAVHTQRSIGPVTLRNQSDSLSGDKLYKNMLAETGRIEFREVTKEAGIYSSQIGYGLGVGVADINDDGYPDIFVSNDFTENDYLYLNNQDGTFQQVAEKAFGHTSRFSMGNDIGDINNDGLQDIITLDMLPRDESVLKTSAGEDSYEVYAFKQKYGYHTQLARNTLQLNQGISDSGQLCFSDIAAFSGIEATDWSWGALLADFDGDGWKDLFVTNGIERRPNDLDYINFISNDSIQQLLSEGQAASVIRKMPDGAVSNVAFRNSGGVRFQEQTQPWGLYARGLSNGAAYGDLDNDGDLDLVVNQLNAEALVYRNESRSEHFVKVKLKSPNLAGNPFAVGAKVRLIQGDAVQLQQLSPVRGWCSSSDYPLVFGLPDPDAKFTIEVEWPDGTRQSTPGRAGTMQITYGGTQPISRRNDEHVLLRSAIPPAFTHHENEFNAFNRESLIPHMLSTEGPPLAAGDVDNDGYTDIFVGGGRGQAGRVFRYDGREFTTLSNPAIERDAPAEDTGALLFDADNDGDLDLVVVAGGQEETTASELIAPRLYFNDGKGRFTKATNAFSELFMQASCVIAADYDQDGDQDLFIGAGSIPMLYGMSPASYLLANDGHGNFQPHKGWLGTSRFDNPTGVRPGMVQDATWADVNNDGLPDIILVGEWMPITVLIQNNQHTFDNRTKEYGLDKTHGWWSAIDAADFDNDGDVDFVVGNAGENSRLRASVDEPLQMFLGDFDSNGGSDHILVYYNGGQPYPFVSRDQLIKQLPGLKKKFLRYTDYRNARLEDIITPKDQGNLARMVTQCMSTLYLENKGDTLETHRLPDEAQWFPIYGILHDDVNKDGNLDILVVGNKHANQPEIGPYDAGLGLLLLGDGHGSFTAESPGKSGVWVTGEARSIALVKANTNGGSVYVISRNNSTVVAYTNQVDKNK